MDLGDFVFFIIFIIIIVSNIFKQVRKQKKSSDTQPVEAKTGWKKTIDDILKDIRAQVEQSAEPASGEPARRRSGWEDLILVESEERKIPQHESRQQPAVKMRPKSIPEAAGRDADFDELRGLGPEVAQRERATRRVREKKSLRGIKEPSLKLPVAASIYGAELSSEDLKNAVIWHELLSPPLGLRNF